MHLQLAWESSNCTRFSVPLIEFLKSNAHLIIDARKRKNLTHLQSILLFKDSSQRPAKNRTGKAAICSMTEKSARTKMDLSYNNPMAALPRNQAMPNPVLKTPNAGLRFSIGAKACPVESSGSEEGATNPIGFKPDLRVSRDRAHGLRQAQDGVAQLKLPITSKLRQGLRIELDRDGP